MSKPINIFIIYAREDKEIKQGILAYLNPFIKPYNLNIWHDAHIEPGQEWKHSIDSRLDQTDLFLMLVSIDFMNSPFIHQVEFKYAVERHKANKSIIVPVITRECPWNLIDFEFDDFLFNLNELQVLPDEGKPIVDWRTPDQGYNNVVTGIRKVFASIKKNQELQESLEKSQAEVKQAQIESDRKKAEEEKKQKQNENEEELLWNLVAEDGSVEKYQEYLDKYPAGKYKSIASTAIRTLESIKKREQKNEEEILWKSSCEINTIVSYKYYLDRSELGLYTGQANNYIAAIEKKNQELLAEKERQLAEEQDNKLWKETADANAIVSYKKYLDETRVGTYTEKATQIIKQLEAEQQEKELESQFWEKATTENTADSYNHYLQRYPGGTHKTAATNAIEAIEKKNQELLAEQQRRLAEEQDNKIWERAEGENTIASYKKYLNETGVGLFSDKAGQVINQLEKKKEEKEIEDQFWQKAKAGNSITIYNDYLQRYPAGTYKPAASDAIKEIEEAERKRQELAEQENEFALQRKKGGKTKTYLLVAGILVVIVVGAWGALRMNTSATAETNMGEQPVSDSTITEKSLDTTGTTGQLQVTDTASAIAAQNRDTAVSYEKPTPSKKTERGEKYQGGVVFQVDYSGEHGLIVAEEDLDGRFSWNAAVEERDRRNSEGYNGYKDWRLPTQNELYSIWKSKIDNFNSKEDYWSSQDYGSTALHLIFGGGGYKGKTTKKAQLKVHLVRDF